MSVEWISTIEGYAARLDGRWVCSSRRPIQEAHRWWVHAQEKVRSVETVFILGLGVGHHVDVLLSQVGLPRVIVIENELEFVSRFASKLLNRVNDISLYHLESPADVFESSRLRETLSTPYAVIDFHPRSQASASFYNQLQSALTGRGGGWLEKHLRLRNWVFDSGGGQESLSEFYSALIEESIESSEDYHKLKVLRELIA